MTVQKRLIALWLLMRASDGETRSLLPEGKRAILIPGLVAHRSIRCA